jgi:mono/diheme cytochrome c family protein
MPRSTNVLLQSRWLAAAGCCLGAAAAVWLAVSAGRGIAANADDAPGAGQTVAINAPPGMAGDPIATPVAMPADPQAARKVARGEYLATAADCQYCHSIPGGAPYAGGQPVQTPFGDLFTPNITPDKTAGIGTMTDAQFWNVMHKGIAPGHSLLVFPRYLYPVMPWQDYNKLSYDDVMAIKAYLMSLTPVAAPDRESEMSFPFTLRAGLLAWRLLFFRNQPINYDPSWSPQVRNGAFLVQALGHCAECHTQRNMLMALEPSRMFGGGHLLAQSWYAPDISGSTKDGAGAWPADQLFAFLHNDGAVGAGAPYGPMKAVVDDSLSRLPDSDVLDIVAYLQTGAAPKPALLPPPPIDPPGQGGALYAENCARCHGQNGEGVARNFPNLAGNPAVWHGTADNVISMVLGGFTPWHQNQSAMPEFNQSLSDGEIADIANYVRTSWSNKARADASAAQVAALRATASDWAVLDTGTTQAQLGDAAFDQISGQVELFGDHENCMLNGNFGSRSGPAISLAGSCAAQGSRLLGQFTVNGKTYPADLRFQEIHQSGRIDQLIVSGPVPGTGRSLSARILLNPPAA